MTLGTIFRSVLGPSSSLPSDYRGAVLSSRNSDFHPYGSRKHHKVKSKTDKKHAVLSALTLLAFLFFLNILQNCIREQNANRGTVMMFAPTGGTAPTGHQAKDPNQDFKSSGSPLGKKRSTQVPPKNRTELSRRARSLLNLDGLSRNEKERQAKFIRNFSLVNNWAKELSSVSDKDLNDQKLKTMNFPLYWKNNRIAFDELRRTLPSQSVSPVLAKGQALTPVLRKFQKREKTPASGDSVQTESKSVTATRKDWDHKKLEKVRPLSVTSNKLYHDNLLSTTKNSWQMDKGEITTPHFSVKQPFELLTKPGDRQLNNSGDHHRNLDAHIKFKETRQNTRTSSTPTAEPNPKTSQTSLTSSYYNHRLSPRGENRADGVATPEPSASESDRTPDDLARETVHHLLFQPTKTTPFRAKYRHRNFIKRGEFTKESRYRYSPYRKTGKYEYPHLNHVRDDFYSPVVLAKYEVQHGEPDFDLVKSLWTAVISFTKPLTKLVPGIAKDNHEETQCYDLLFCEAQRVAKLMGPSAEAVTNALGTFFTLTAKESTRQILIDAFKSGRENTCQEQIRNCENRSGGKSAVTIIAQVFEMKSG